MIQCKDPQTNKQAYYNVLLPSALCRIVQITASSSIGLRVQVEYTIRPPVANISTARANIRSCILKRK